MDLKPILYGLASALAWGAGDFGGGVASRRVGNYAVAIWTDVVAVIVVSAFALLEGESLPVARDSGLALVSGVFGGLGLLLLYQSFSEGKMSIAAPVSALMSGALPVLVGIVAEGVSSPKVMIGLALALVGIWLVAREDSSDLDFNWVSIRAPLLAGVFFALFFILMNGVQVGSVLWPVVLVRVSAIATVTVLGLRKRESIRPPMNLWYILIPIGVFSPLGSYFFLLASQAGRLDVSSVLASLYPGITILLAWLFLRERVSKLQRAGIACALIAIVLIAI